MENAYNPLLVENDNWSYLFDDEKRVYRDNGTDQNTWEG